MCVGYYGVIPQFSVDERVFMVLKYTEIGNVLKTISGLGL